MYVYSGLFFSFYLSKLSYADIVNAGWNSQWLLKPWADIVSDLSIMDGAGRFLL